MAISKIKLMELLTDLKGKKMIVLFTAPVLSFLINKIYSKLSLKLEKLK